MGCEYYQTVDPLEKEPQVGRGLFGVHLLILHFKFQFSPIFEIFNISYFPQLHLSFKKKISPSQNAQKPSKNLRKTAKHWFMFKIEGFGVA